MTTLAALNAWTVVATKVYTGNSIMPVYWCPVDDYSLAEIKQARDAGYLRTMHHHPPDRPGLVQLMARRIPGKSPPVSREVRNGWDVVATTVGR